MRWTKENIDFDNVQRLLSKLAEHVKAFHSMTTAEITGCSPMPKIMPRHDHPQGGKYRRSLHVHHH